jgi:hypothetical protein
MKMSCVIRGTLIVAIALAAACDRVPLLAPTGSTITLSAGTRVLPSGGSTELTAFVMEQSGTPVHDGTVVRFSTSLGSVSPVEAETRNGAATATFLAGTASGIAEVRAISGGAGGGTSGGTGGGTTTATGANVVQITVGAAAVNTITLRANPGSVGPSGGSVELVATVVAENGRSLDGILVTFNTDQGRLSSATAITNSAGEARTTLTTNQQTVVSATAGTKTSSNVTVAVRSAPAITITCAAGTATNCNAVEANSANQATVVFTVTRPTTSSALSSVTIDFGDGTSQSLGNLAGGTATVTHTYAGPGSDNAPVTYTATVRAVDVNGEVTSTSIGVGVNPRPVFSVTFTATAGTQGSNCQRWEFTATPTPSTTTVQSYRWDFDDGSSATTSGNRTSHVYTESGRQVVTVEAKTPDGRTATAREEIIVQFSSSAASCS